MKRTPLQRRTELKRTGLLNSTMPHDVEERPAPQKPRKPMKRRQPERDWSDARAKVERQGVCRVEDDHCLGPLEAAHVVGRICDRPKDESGGALYVHPDSIVPLCKGHHGMYDDHRFDLLPYLSLDEQLRAVEDADGLELARVRTCPSEYRDAA